MTIFTVLFSQFWLQILNLPASLQNKNTRIGPFPWKRSVLQNPDRERTNQSTGICLGLGLPYNKYSFYMANLGRFRTDRAQRGPYVLSRPRASIPQYGPRARLVRG